MRNCFEGVTVGEVAVGVELIQRCAEDRLKLIGADGPQLRTSDDVQTLRLSLIMIRKAALRLILM